MSCGKSPKGYPLLLVTGFGPFPGKRFNPSAALARAVASEPRWRRIGIEARALVLATTWPELDHVLGPALDGPRRPGAVIMIGVAARSRTVRIERRATRRRDALLPDAAGHASPLRADPGPPARRSGMPPATVAAILKRQGVPCRISNDAGRYLCNAAYYLVLGTGTPALFLHVPRRSDPARPARTAGSKRRLSWEERLTRAFVSAGVALIAEARRKGTGAPAAVARASAGR